MDVQHWSNVVGIKVQKCELYAYFLPRGTTNREITSIFIQLSESMFACQCFNKPFCFLTSESAHVLSSCHWPPAKLCQAARQEMPLGSMRGAALVNLADESIPGWTQVVSIHLLSADPDDVFDLNWCLPGKRRRSTGNHSIQSEARSHDFTSTRLSL